MKSCRFPLTRHSDGNTFLNLYPNGRVVTLNNTLDDGSGDITASGWIEAGNGGAVIFGGTSAVNGSGSGGASFSGRPRIGDWGQWLTIGEPNGTNNGTIIQIDGSSQHIGFGTSSGITNSPSIKSRINISSGGRFEGQTSNYAYLANGQYNSTVNGGGNRTFGNFTTGATGSVHVTGFFTASGNSAGTWYIWTATIGTVKNGGSLNLSGQQGTINYESGAGSDQGYVVLVDVIITGNPYSSVNFRIINNSSSSYDIYGYWFAGLGV